MNHTALDTLAKCEAGDAVRYALEAFLANDSELLRRDANERSITARIAMYLQQALPKLHVDCEYNRDGVDPKRLAHFHLFPEAEDTEAKTVFPDIIAHVRGTEDNYLVIELKKSTSTVCRDIDFIKLQGYKRQLGYTHALYVELTAGAEPDVLRLEWVNASNSDVTLM